MTIAIPIGDGSGLLRWVCSYSEYRIYLYDRLEIDMMWYNMGVNKKTRLELDRQRRLIAHHKKY